MFAKVSKYWFGLFLLLPLTGAAQSFDDDIASIVEKVGASDNYTIISTVKVYSKKGGTLVHQMDASVMSSKSATHTVMGEVEMLTSDAQVIVVDRDEKLIEVQNIPKAQQGKSKQKANSTLKLEDLEKLGSGDSGLKFTLASTSGTVRTYSASNAKMGVKSIVIKLDATNKKLISYTTEQLDENGKPGQYVQVDYSDFSYTVEKPDLLKSAHFVSNEGGAYKAATAFKGYKVVKK